MADSTVVALVFEDENAAERLFNTLEQTLKAESLPIDNAAVAIYKQDGEIIVRQMVHPISENGFDTQLWEFVIRTLLSGWGYHIDDWSIEKFKQLFRPGTSAFFTLIEPNASGEVITKLRQFNGNLIYAGFTEEQKVQLREAASQSR
ncbi:MAG: DUF1269 domain-containing protein [Ktedonobacteraceae bacterium]|nr:DUF1269 domain-containing protein [Ktedonobacteraceae bacterium]